MAILFTLLTLISTLFGGIFGLVKQKKLHLIMAFAAGVLIAVVAFDILPEIIRIEEKISLNINYSMIALVSGFLLFHTFEKLALIHYHHDNLTLKHHHPSLGILSALALSGHSFLDGVGIGLAFHLSQKTGVLVSLAVIAHDFTDGLNTVSFLLLNQNNYRQLLGLLVLDALTPTVGVLSTALFTIPQAWLCIYLGFFAGFLLYIGASDILPEAYSQSFDVSTVLMTLFGTVFIFLVSRVAF